MIDPIVMQTDESRAALVVEDNALVAETLAEGLTALGCSSVERVASVGAALKAVAGHDIDIAVVETHAKGISTEPVMEALDSKGIAYVVASFDGCNSLPGHPPYLQKPFGFSDLKTAVIQAHHQASIRSWYRVQASTEAL